MYAPAPPGYERRHAREAELERINARIYALTAERNQHRIGGPIAMMAGGYGSALLFGLIAVSSFAAAEAIQHEDAWDRDNDWNDDGVITKSDERDARTSARVATALAAVGLGVGIGGTVWFSKRMAKRRVGAPELHDLKLQRRQILRGLRYSANGGPDSMQFTLRGRF